MRPVPPSWCGRHFDWTLNWGVVPTDDITCVELHTVPLRRSYTPPRGGVTGGEGRGRTTTAPASTVSLWRPVTTLNIDTFITTSEAPGVPSWGCGLITVTITMTVT